MLICFRMVWLFLNRWRQTKFEYGLHSMLEYQCVNKHKPKCNLLSLPFSRSLLFFFSIFCNFSVALPFSLYFCCSGTFFNFFQTEQLELSQTTNQVNYLLFYAMCNSIVNFVFISLDWPKKKKTFRENDSNSVDVLCIYLSIVRCSFIVSILNLGMAVFLFRK